MVDDPASQSYKVTLAETTKPLVLLVEDDFIISSNIEFSLTEAGFVALAAANADEAMLAFKDNSALVRALITDIRMPGEIDGWALARRVRELPMMPVIYMTGDSARNWSAEGVPKSVLLQKPFADAQLLTALTTLLNEAETTGIGR